MRRTALIAIAAAAVTGCGSEERATPAEVQDEPGLAVFQAQGCGSCHRLSSAGSSSSIGPNLDNALRNRSRDSIIQAIVDPPRDSVMPADFEQRMNDAELVQLVDFLVKSSK